MDARRGGASGAGGASRSGGRTLLAGSLITALVLFLATGPGQGAAAQGTGGSGTSYHVDCAAGSDTHSGTSPAQAWRTLERANEASLAPGESLLLKRGCAWNGPLRVRWQGTATAPIRVAAYGSGELPVVQSATDHVDAVFVTGTHVVLDGLWARGVAPRHEAGCANAAVGQISGFRFAGTAAYNVLQHSRATNLTDGVKIERSAHHQRILHNTLANNDVMAELSTSAWDDYGAFGVNVHGDDNEVAYNVISGSDACSYDYGRDGAAVEVYGGQRNNIHHNRGADNLTFTELGDARSADNRFAFNVVTSTLQDANFLITRGSAEGFGPVTRTKAYNNTVHLAGRNATAVVCVGGCGSEVLTLKNNIVWSEHQVAWVDGPLDEGHNLYWRADGTPQFKGAPTSQTSVRADPRFRNAAPGALDLHLTQSSPAIGAGTQDATTAGYNADADGVAVPTAGRVDAGALAYASAPPPATATPAPTAIRAPSAPSATATPSRTGGPGQEPNPSRPRRR